MSKDKNLIKKVCWLICDIDITLGQGAFGKVVRAEAVGILEAEEKTDVAVKMVRSKISLLFHSHNGVSIHQAVSGLVIFLLSSMA